MPFPKVDSASYVTEDGGDFYTTEDDDPLIASSGTISGGILYRLHSAVGEVQSQTWDDAISILDSAVADNDRFTLQDANDWYRRLGIYNSGTVPRLDMMKAINQKLNYPGEKVYGRSYYAFIQEQLQAAGFDVRVYENRFPDGSGGYITKTPGEILGIPYGAAEHGLIEHGDTEHGGYSGDVTKAVQFLEESKDELFYAYALTPMGYRSTFFIAGSTIDTFANISISRKVEFRQLLNQIKPLQMCGFLFTRYS